MPLYYFHFRDNNFAMPDPEGTELPDLVAALGEAWIDAREFIANELKSGRSLPDGYIEIADKSGEVLATLWFREVWEHFQRLKGT